MFTEVQHEGISGRDGQLYAMAYIYIEEYMLAQESIWSGIEQAW